MEASTAEKSSSHIRDGMCNGVNELKLVGGEGGGVCGPADDDIDEIVEDGVEVSRAFGCEWEKYIGWIFMLFGVVGNLGIVRNVGSLGVLCLFTCTG